MKNGLTPRRRATRASQTNLSYRVCMIVETRRPLDRTMKTISFARDTHVAPHRARTTPVSSSRRSWSVTDATATPWKFGEAAESTPSSF